MHIKINLAALKETKWHEYAIRVLFGGVLFGGLITVATGLIARKFGPAVGSLFLAFPAIFPATATLIATHEKEQKQRAGRDAAAIEARGTAIGTIGLLAFGAIVWRLLPTHPAWLILTGAAAAWFAVSVLLWRVRIARSSHMPLKRQSRPETNLESRYEALTIGGEIQAPPAELAQAASKHTYHWSVNRDVKQEAEQP